MCLQDIWLLNQLKQSYRNLVFFESVVCKQGIPKTLVTDQSKEFVNEILKGVAKLLQMKHITTTPYLSQTNGVIERWYCIEYITHFSAR